MHKTRKSNNNWAKKSDCMGKKETLLDQQKKICNSAQSDSDHEN